MILVIEDDPGIQKVLHRLFITDGFQVRAAHDGKEAQEAMKGPAPEVVILDLMLPGASGKDICKSLKRTFPNVPVIVLSAVSEVSDKVLLLELGADDYVTKPFSPRELLARVQAAIRRVAGPRPVKGVFFWRSHRGFSENGSETRWRTDNAHGTRIQIAQVHAGEC